MSTATTASTGVRLTAMPKVDLLPPEIALEARFRTLRLGLGLGVVASMAAVGLLWFNAHASYSGAHADLVNAQAQQVGLQTEVQKYADVPVAFASVQAAQAQLTLAMGHEIRFSYMLNDLSMTIPAKVWLTNVTITEDVDGTAPPTGPFGDTGVAHMAVQGVASTYPDVAAWLQMLGKGKYYTDPYFSDAHVGALIGTKAPVDFSSDVVVTPQAYSNRYANNGSTQ
jgi:Tfp pilus assembly protein PilN